MTHLAVFAAAMIGLAMLVLKNENYAQMSAAGLELCEAHRGVTERHLNACLELLRKKQSGSDPD